MTRTTDEKLDLLSEIAHEDLRGTLAYLAGILEAKREDAALRDEDISNLRASTYYAVIALREELAKW